MTVPTIFVIDDQESVRHAIGEMLSVFGFSVQTFASALRFLEQVEPERAGCVVADTLELVGDVGQRDQKA